MLALIQMFSLCMVHPATLYRDEMGKETKSFPLLLFLIFHVAYIITTSAILCNYLELTLLKKIGRGPEGRNTMYFMENL